MDADWLWGLAGGLMIGGAAALYLLGNGRIMGASGILGGLVDGSARGEARRERLAFLVGLLTVPALLALISGGAETHLSTNVVLVVAAGLAVGVGTRLANGCTSGHGVCGISRFSVRGIVATLCYLLAGGLTVLVFRHGLGLV
ncbi:MAG: YeeE/YedE family protein [Pseudomonadota bacterium]